MKNYHIDIGKLVSPMSKVLDQREADVLYTVCYLSAHLKLIAYAFNIKHSPSRVGWIIDPIKIISPLLPKLSISASLKALEKRELILVGKNPDRILPNPVEIEKLAKLFTTIDLPDECIHTDTWDKLSNQEYWDHIPGVSDGLEKVTLETFVAHTKASAVWSQQYPFLQNAPDYLLDVAYMVFNVAGFAPETRDCIPAYLQLHEVSTKNSELLKKGLERGNATKVKSGLSLTHPRSYVPFVREVVAELRIASDGEPKRKIII